MNGSPSGLLRGPDAFRNVYVGALALCAIMLPWSTAFLSMAQMLLAANWLAEGIVRKDLLGRFRRVVSSAPALVFLSFFGLHVLGLAWSDDLQWGLDLVRILLPVLVFGVILSGSPRLRSGEYNIVLLLGAWSVVCSTFVNLGLHNGSEMDYRSLSHFISHIRLTLLLCSAIVIFLLDKSAPMALRIAGYAAAIWSLVFIDQLASIQGVIILGSIGLVFLFRAAGRWSPVPKYGTRALSLALPLLLIGWTAQQLRGYFALPDAKLGVQVERTAGGEAYTHDLANPQQENGTHVFTYFAWGELRRTWPLRSSVSLDSSDAQGHVLWGTLTRYLTSKGARKDSVSIMALTDAEVRGIEQGNTDAYPERTTELRKRLDEVGYELGQYRAYGRANGHSVSMRLEFLKAGWAIAKQHWLVGVGTGDTKQVFSAQYETMNSSLAPEWRHRAHDQYLTLWISFGVFGMVWSLITWWWPAYRLGAWKRAHFIAWAIIFGVSCLSDDTIETQAGATFFALYYTLFVFAAPDTINQRADRKPVAD